MPIEDQEPGAAAQRPDYEVAGVPRHPDYDAEQQKREEQKARDEFNAHPHTRLTALAADLGTKRVDLHDRIGAIHRVLGGLIGLALQNTPPPRSLEEHDEVG